MCGREGVRGRGGGHAWQGVGMVGVGWCGCVHDIGGMCGFGGAWQEGRPLKRAVRILLECILVFLNGYSLFPLHQNSTKQQAATLCNIFYMS